MLKRLTKDYPFLLMMTVLGVFVAAGFLINTRTLYEASGSAVMYRNPVEGSNYSPEDSKNRWIWVRDGMTIAESLVTDDFLVDFIKGNEKLMVRFGRFQGRHPGPPPDQQMLMFARRIRERIKVDYTGGDSNRFNIKVRDRDRDTSAALANALLARLPKVVNERMAKAYASAIGKLDKGLTKEALTTKMTIDNAFSDQRLEIVTRPVGSEHPVWPPQGLILAAGAFIGLTLGWGIDWLRRRKKR